MGEISRFFEEKGPDHCITKIRDKLAAKKVNPAWAGTFLAALLEKKSGLEITLMSGDSEVITLITPPPPPPPPPEPAAPEQPVEAPPKVYSLAVQFGFLHLPEGDANAAEWRSLADTIPVTGILTMNADLARVRVALGKAKALGIGESYTITKGDEIYSFCIDKVDTDGNIYFSGTILSANN